ncbi:MAG TPA: class I SAM-dependent methyltransferase [Mycobacteriales bacterium]|nr:class I SAM-dependent methyltransferase [Mycobacteriales bacterium]
MGGLSARVAGRLRHTLPPAVIDAVAGLRLTLDPQRRRRMRADATTCVSVQDWLDFGRRHLPPGAVQRDVEAVGFFEYAAQSAPRRVCELGTQYGGNNLIMSQMLPAEQVIGVDLHVCNRGPLRLLAPAGQRLSYLNGSTTDPKTLAAVERLLGGELLDLLFIDGDHSFEGVRSDFLTYRHLVRPGGIIAFHDIQTDGRELGEVNNAYAGGVPVMWRLVRDRYPSREFIADPVNQRGFGIGAITYSPDIVVTPDDLRENLAA